MTAPQPSAAEAEQNLATLRRQRGAAVLDGAVFDDATIAGTETEIDRLSDAEAEADRRKRAASAEANRQRITGLCERLVAAEARRVDAVQRAEKSAREMDIAIDAAIDASQSVAVLCANLESLAPPAAERTIAAISAGLASLLSKPGRANRAAALGHHVKLKPAFHPPGHTWLEPADFTSIIERAKRKSA